MRTNKVILIVGNRGTGKTDFVKNLIHSQMQTFPKQLIVDTFDSDVWHNLQTWNNPQGFNIEIPVIQGKDLGRWRKGIARMFSAEIKPMLAQIQEGAKNTFLVFEDATKYVGSRLTDDMRKFVLDSKQKNLDIVFIFHSLASIPPELVRVSDILVLFKTNEGKVSETKYPWGEIPKMMELLRKSVDKYKNLVLQLH